MRSTLYVPGDQPEKMAKAVASAADAVILDLEDAVAPTQKVQARSAVISFLGGPAPSAGSALHAGRCMVRVNAGAHGLDDLDHLVRACRESVSTYYLPKVGTVRQLVEATDLLDALERELSLPDETLQIVALIESAEGLSNAGSIAQCRRLKRLAIGEADLVSELGIEPSPDDRELLHARSMVVIAATAAGLEPPMGPVSTNFTDLESLRASSIALRRMGFRGRSCIHPNQLSVVNEVFTPTPQQLARAAFIVELYDAALFRGAGAVVDEHGRMLDEAVVRSARRLVAAFSGTPEFPTN